MTTLTLTYQGPAAQARAALAVLLQRFRSAYFVERSSTEYVVTADGKTALELKRLPEWSHHQRTAGRPRQTPGKS
ncbi:MAG: hypothetical protein JOY60_06360 [Burkholderiaceae bacterium]|nr:hypothetical protein [Roseateles sp.]MBV8469471.1 hypothetical protein [Burkholderiaceae bacterium]